MRRGGLATLAAAVLVVSVAVSAAGLGGSVAAEPSMTLRAFTVRAEGFPVEPAPGTNETSLGVRPLGTRVSLNNAPADAYARATTTDLGTIELYTGPPPPGNTAECDATRPNLPRDAVVEPGGAHLEAHCTGRPSALVLARAGGPAEGPVRAGSQSSRVTADGGGPALLATSDVVLVDVELGPVRIGTARFRGRVSANGRRGGASARGVVEALDASVSGVPVVIGTDGVAVDQTRVPLDLVPTASEAVRAAMAQGGYSDVRIVRPNVTSAADGTNATVQGGGIVVYLSNNDPKNDYYVSLTLVGARLAVFAGAPLGGVLAGGADDIAASVAQVPATPAVGGGGGGAVAIEAPAGSGLATDVAVPALEVVGRTTYRLPRPWRGWWAIAVAAGALAILALALRRRVASWWDGAATRFLRG